MKQEREWSDRSDPERQTDHLTSVTSLPFLCFHTILCLRYMHNLLEKNDYRNRCAFCYTLRFLKFNKIIFPVPLTDAPAILKF